MALGGNVKMALLWMVVGAVFDFFDGMVARLLHVTSPIGKELDSLADDITFGVAPSSILFYMLCVMEYPSFLEPYRDYLPYFAYIMAAFSALRLAKFNLDERQTTSFIGLPTPANALFWGSMVVANSSWLEGSSYCVFVLMALILGSSLLLVSELPMFALKFKHWGWKGNEVRYIFVGISFVFLLLFGILEAWWMVITAYFLLSCYLYLRGERICVEANDKSK